MPTSPRPMRRSILIPALAVIAVAALAGCGNPAAPQGNYGTIMGTVTSSTGQPVAGAVVTADAVLSATTGADGRYSIPTVPVDSPTTTTTVTCTATGYQDAAPKQVTVAAGKQLQVDFSITKL